MSVPLRGDVAAGSADGFAVRSVSRSHVGRVRLINEDRVFDDAAEGLWAIADGMGGHSGGDLAAQQVVDCLRDAVASPAPVTPDRVRKALIAANALIVARNRRLGVDAGATAVAATLRDGVMEIMWAGDSRAYRLDNAGARQLTRDHSVVQQLVDAGLITADRAEHHPQAHVVTRAFGVVADVALATVRVNAGPARYLLCSDGLSRSLRDGDLRTDLSLSALADRLIGNAIDRDGTDNASLVLIDVEHRQY